MFGALAPGAGAVAIPGLATGHGLAELDARGDGDTITTFVDAVVVGTGAGDALDALATAMFDGEAGATVVDPAGDEDCLPLFEAQAARNATITPVKKTVRLIQPASILRDSPNSGFF